MPLLGGLFSRKNKPSPQSRQDDRSIHSNTGSDLDSAFSSPTTSSYAHQNRPHPNAQNLLHPDSARQNYLHAPSIPSTPTPSSSSSKLRNPFGRKKSPTPGSNLPSTSPLSSNRSLSSAPWPTSDSRASTDTDAERRLRPPPSRSAIFAAYGDPNSALSTHSLPNDNRTSSETSHFPAPAPQNPHKRPSIFPWAKNSQSATPPPISQYNGSASPSNLGHDLLGSPNDEDSHSFNLKSFRHIRPPSPNGSNFNDSNISLPPPVPRPRGPSVNSESSQRISVAAFREAQARRSMAGSPSPSLRSPSPAPGLPQTRTMTPEMTRGQNGPRPSRSASNVPGQQQQRRRSSMAIAYTSDSDPSASSSEEDSEDETVHPSGRMQPSSSGRSGRSVGKAKARSEIGHGQTGQSTSRPSDFPLTQRGPRSHVGHSSQQAFNSSNKPDGNANVPDVPSRPQSSLSVYTTGLRKRASVSTSALTPNSAAKRASVIAASNSKMGISPISQNGSSANQFQNSPRTTALASPSSWTGAAGQPRSNAPRTPQPDSDSDSEDNAPLASLVAPRRPGSAMSSYSNLTSRSTGNVTTRSNGNSHAPPKPLIDIKELTGPKRSYTSPLEKEKSTAGFTEGTTLLSQGKSALSNKPQQPHPQPSSPLVESPVSMTSRSWHTSPPPPVLNLPLTQTVPPVNFISPPPTPSREMDQFMARPEAERAPPQRSSTADTSPVPPARREMSPDQKRDALTERLSRVVKQATSPTPSAAIPAVVHATPQAPQKGSSLSRATSPGSGSGLSDSSDNSRTRKMGNQANASSGAQAPAQSQSQSQSQMAFPTSAPAQERVPSDEELAALIGNAQQFMSRLEEGTPEKVDKKKKKDDSSDDSGSSSSSSESDDDGEEEEEPKDRIAPIPIKQRSPPPAFSVTSRPPLSRQNNANSSGSPRQDTGSASMGYTPRPRSVTLQNTSTSPTHVTRKSYAGESILAPVSVLTKASSNLGHGSSSNNTMSSAKSSDSVSLLRPTNGPRQRSSTMITGVPLSAQMNKNFGVPDKPFAARRNSPASSTGDSSSGRAPLTPRDGSDIVEEQGAEKPRKQHIKRRSVSFEDDMDDLRPPSRSRFKDSGRASPSGGESSNDEEREERRRDRRRNEAKAAIELGNVINGRGPIVEDDDDLPINQAMNSRMPSMNPMMGMGAPMSMQMGQMGFGGAQNPAAWNMSQQSMLSPAQFMIPPPQDPNFLAAHQHAMAMAKQAYQMAVAQQAMAAAADEWERGSTMGGLGGGSVYGGGGGSVYGGGGGSVYGGGGGSVFGGSQGPSMMNSPFNMMAMMQNGGGWGSQSVYGGGGAQSMYGGSQLGVGGGGMMSSSRSEYGGGGGRAQNWSSSRSSYGEAFGPDQSNRKGAPPARRSNNPGRDSGYLPPVPSLPLFQSSRSSQALSDGRPSMKPTKSTSPARSGAPRKAAPPSSWKQGI